MMSSSLLRVGALALALALTQGCSRKAQTAAPEGPTKGASAPAVGDTAKPTAPVDAQATMGTTTGRVTLKFGAASDDVRVDVTGVDGMVVTSPPTPLIGATVAQGDVRNIDVEFVPGPGVSRLALSVAGTFHGSRQTKILTFPVGSLTSSEEKPGTHARVVLGPDGQGVKILPTAR